MNPLDFIILADTAAEPTGLNLVWSWIQKNAALIKAVMRAIVESGFDGYVAQEFIPTWKDKALAPRHAAEVCDV